MFAAREFQETFNRTVSHVLRPLRLNYTRARVLVTLRDRDRTKAEIARAGNIKPGTIGSQTGILENRGYVTKYRKNRFVYYRLTQKGRDELPRIEAALEEIDRRMRAALAEWSRS